jgi:hypothetical protein
MSKPSSNDLRLEQALLSELPEGVRLPDDQAEQLAALRQDNESILDKYPAARVAKEIERRVAKERAPRRLWLWSPAVLAPALVLAVLWAGKRPVQPGPERLGDDAPIVGIDTDVQLKGQRAELRVYRKPSGQAAQTPPERLREGSVVHPGDVLQLSYLAAGQGQGVIVSYDGRGSVELHHPISGTPTLLRGGEHALPRAYKLDDAPRFERFLLVTTQPPASLDVAQVVTAVKALASGADPEHATLTLPGAQVFSLTLRKALP